MDLGARKSGQFDFGQDLRFFKHLYLFYEKELDAFPTGDYEYLGDIFFRLRRSRKGEERRKLLLNLHSVHPPEVRTLDNVHPPEVQTLQNEHFS